MVSLIKKIFLLLFLSAIQTFNAANSASSGAKPAVTGHSFVVERTVNPEKVIDKTDKPDTTNKKEEKENSEIIIVPVGNKRIEAVKHNVNGKILLIKTHQSRDVIENAIAILEQPIQSTLTIVSLLHPEVNKPTVDEVKKQWNQKFDRKRFIDKTDQAHLQKIFPQLQNERILFFGDIEIAADGSGHYIHKDKKGKVTLDISLAWLNKLAKENDVELMFIGCKSFLAGASAGVLENIPGEQIFSIIKDVQNAMFRQEFYAAFSTADNPVFIDPEKLVSEHERQRVEIYRVHDEKPIVRYSPVTPKKTPTISSGDSPPPLPNPTPNPNKIKSGDILEIGFWSLIGFGFMQAALLNPIYQIVKYQNYRYGHFPGLRRLLAKITIEESRESRFSEGSAAGASGCLLLLATPFALYLNFWLGLLGLAWLILFFKGEDYFWKNKEYER